MKGRAEKVKAEFSLNFHVYAWHFKHCLYFIYARKNYAKRMTLPAKEGLNANSHVGCFVSVTLLFNYMHDPQYYRRNCYFYNVGSDTVILCCKHSNEMSEHVSLCTISFFHMTFKTFQPLLLLRQSSCLIVWYTVNSRSSARGTLYLNGQF